MSDYVGIWAEVRAPDEAIARWLASRARGSAWKDWSGLLADAGTSSRRAKVEGVVREILAEAKKVGRRRSLFELRVGKGAVHLRGVLSLDDDLATCVELAVALRAMDKLGATGDVVVLSLTDDALNAHINLGKGGSRCTKAPPARRTAVQEALEEAIEQDESKSAKSADTPAAKVARDTKTLIEDNIARMRASLAQPEVVALHGRLLAALVEHCPSAAIVKLAKGSYTKLRRAKSLTLDAAVDEMRASFQEGAFGKALAAVAQAHFEALELLAEHDIRSAETIALALIEHRCDWSTLEVLSRSKVPEARDALLRRFQAQADAPMYAALIASALMRMRDMGVGEQTLPLLEGAVRAAPGALTGDEGFCDGPFMSAPKMDHLLNVCAVLAAHPYEPGHSAVARLYEDCAGAIRERVFQRGGQWWFKQTLRGVEKEHLIGPRVDADAALQSSGVYSRAVCLSFELARRLLLDGKVPRNDWRLRSGDGALKRADALLARRRRSGA